MFVKNTLIVKRLLTNKEFDTYLALADNPKKASAYLKSLEDELFHGRKDQNDRNIEDGTRNNGDATNLRDKPGRHSKKTVSGKHSDSDSSGRRQRKSRKKDDGANQ